MEFKSYEEGGLFCYLSIETPPLEATLPNQVLSDGSRQEAGNSSRRLRRYLNWAETLAGGKSLWVIIRLTPESAELFGHLQPTGISWKYDVVANDTEGMGIDKGFVPAQAPYSPLNGDQSQGSLLFRLPDLKALLELPEDVLGDVNSPITVLAVQGEGSELVAKLKQQDAPPQISSLLGTNDLFIQLAVGKEHGYYDSFLVKANQNIEEALQPLV